MSYRYTLTIMVHIDLHTGRRCWRIGHENRTNGDELFPHHIHSHCPGNAFGDGECICFLSCEDEEWCGTEGVCCSCENNRFLLDATRAKVWHEWSKSVALSNAPVFSSYAEARQYLNLVNHQKADDACFYPDWDYAQRDEDAFLADLIERNISIEAFPVNWETLEEIPAQYLDSNGELLSDTLILLKLFSDGSSC